MNRIDPDAVCRRYDQLNVATRAGELGVIMINGKFAPLRPGQGVCALGVLVLYEDVPSGFMNSQLQEAVNFSLGLTRLYAWGVFDGFAGWGTPISLYDASQQELKEYMLGRADGASVWLACDPARKAERICRDAAELLKSTGWTRGNLCKNGKYTIDGAIRMVMWGDVKYRERLQYTIVMEVLEEFLQRRHNISVLTAPWWNNNICMNAAEAIDILERVARGDSH